MIDEAFRDCRTEGRRLAATARAVERELRGKWPSLINSGRQELNSG